jgi:pyruvate formate lyase activating enzyme
MRIAAIEYMTLTDFPGKVAAIVYTLGCNMRCPYCYNIDLLSATNYQKSGRKEIEKEMFFSYLKKNKNMLDGVAITGGEPTMNKSIIPFCEKIKKMGFEIKLDTNGSYPETLKELLDKKLIDYIAMDVKAPLEKYSMLGYRLDVKNISKSITLIKKSGLPHEFRCTMNPQLSEEDFKKIGELCRGSQLYLQELMYDTEFIDNSIKDLPPFTEKTKKAIVRALNSITPTELR